eukprot:8132473-Karenia_brevis.AAC.1
MMYMVIQDPPYAIAAVVGSRLPCNMNSADCACGRLGVKSNILKEKKYHRANLDVLLVLARVVRLMKCTQTIEEQL